jgi:hypothetical protein
LASDLLTAALNTDVSLRGEALGKLAVAAEEIGETGHQEVRYR